MTVNSIIKGTLTSTLAIVACGLSVPAYAQAIHNNTNNDNNAIIHNNAADSNAMDNSAIESEQTTMSYGSAEAGAPAFTVKGMARFRMEERKNIGLTTTGNALTNKLGQMLIKIRPEMTYAPDSNVSVVVAPQFAKTFGLAATGSQGAATSASGGTVDSAADFHYGYIDWHPNDTWKIMAGRQIFSYGNELLIGALEWNNFGRTFDAVRGRYTMKDLGWIDVFTSRITDNSNFTSQAGQSLDTDLHGIYTNWNLGSYLKNVDVYLLNRQQPDQANNSLWALGGRVQSAMGGMDYRAEFTYEKNPYANNGDTASATTARNDNGTQIDVELGYTVDMSMKPRFGVEFATASESFNQLYPTAHKWLGYADVFGRRNIQDIVIKGSIAPMSDFSMDLDIHLFSRAKDDRPMYTTGAAAIGTVTSGVTASSAKSAGTELDLTVKYQASKNVALVGGASVLMPGQYLKDISGAPNSGEDMDKPYFGFVQMEAKF